MVALELAKHNGLIAYPNPSATETCSREKEAEKLGILRLIEAGSEQVQGHSILGKGYCGLVMKAEWQNKERKALPVALKARRLDAPKSDLNAEALALALVNQILIGPTLYAHSDNFIVMEYIDGPSILRWLQDEHSVNEVNGVIQNILLQAFQLDQLGLDHGNLRCVTEHILFRGNDPILIDYSSCSFERRAANVTTLTQGLFFGTIIPSLIAKHRPLPTKDTLIPLLRAYKQNSSPKTFDQLLTQIMQS